MRRIYANAGCHFYFLPDDRMTGWMAFKTSFPHRFPSNVCLIQPAPCYASIEPIQCERRELLSSCT